MQFLADKAKSLAKMRDRHQMEMTRACEHVGFAYTAEDVTILASKHLADSEVIARCIGFHTLSKPAVGNLIYYHGSHELCIIAGGTQNQLTLS